jgi:hypothetical protein
VFIAGSVVVDGLSYETDLGSNLYFLSHYLDCNDGRSLFDDTAIIEKDDKIKPSGVKKAFLTIIGGNAFYYIITKEMMIRKKPT